MDDEDDLIDTQPSRVRLWMLLAALAVVIVVAGAGLWWVLRPQVSAPAPTLGSNPIGRDQAEAQKLPEYADLRGMTKRPLTDADITRAIELTQHPNGWIRVEARNRLSRVLDGPRRADAVDAVAAGLREETVILRGAALIDLGGMKAREREADIRALLTSPIEEDRAGARRALQEIGLPVE